MDANTLLVAGALFGVVIALPGTIVSILLLKDRWRPPRNNHPHDC